MRPAQWFLSICGATLIAAVNWYFVPGKGANRKGRAATGSNKNMRVTLPVSGMTCAACQARVQEALERSPGVETAVVNLLTGQAVVVYSPAITSPAGTRRPIPSLAG